MAHSPEEMAAAMTRNLEANTGKKLSSIVKCYNPAGTNSQDRYNWIKKHLANAVEEALSIRSSN